jgi:hypothetical protein
VNRSREGEKERDSIYIQKIMRENFDALALGTRHSESLASGYVTVSVGSLSSDPDDKLPGGTLQFSVDRLHDPCQFF